MSDQLDESNVLIAFARSAAKAQEVEALFREIIIAAEVATDAKRRSYEAITAEIDKLPLGPHNKKFMEFVKSFDEPGLNKLWNELNRERIFLVHKFFSTFPLPLVEPALSQASQRLDKIDKLLEAGRQLLRIVRDKSCEQFGITQDFLKSVTERRANSACNFAASPN